MILVYPKNVRQSSQLLAVKKVAVDGECIMHVWKNSMPSLGQMSLSFAAKILQNNCCKKEADKINV